MIHSQVDESKDQNCAMKDTTQHYSLMRLDCSQKFPGNVISDPCLVNVRRIALWSRLTKHLIERSSKTRNASRSGIDSVLLNRCFQKVGTRIINEVGVDLAMMLYIKTRLWSCHTTTSNTS
jgi:hypothetical protein